MNALNSALKWSFVATQRPLKDHAQRIHAPKDKRKRCEGFSNCMSRQDETSQGADHVIEREMKKKGAVV